MEQLVGEIFDRGVDDGGDYYPVKIVGGERGSAIERYCNQRGIPFVAFESSEVEVFYSLSPEELINLARRQAEEERELVIDESDGGYRIKLSDGTLTFSALENDMDGIVITPTRIQLNKFRRDLVKRVIIGNKITGISDWAFDDYENLVEVLIGADVSEISAKAFCGREISGSWGCRSLANILVDHDNKCYKSVDGVLFTHDMQTLVRYSPAKTDLCYKVDARVCHIGELAFMSTEYLECLYMGDGCVSIGELAFLNAHSLRHVYFTGNELQWPERFPFVEMNGYDRPYRLGIIFGGPDGSPIDKKCNDEIEHFHVVEKEQIEDFLATPVPEKKDDRYMQDCLKKMIVSKSGILEQVGEFGDELILPEGVVSTRNRINLSKCKRVVIPSTMEYIWTDGFDGPAPYLCEFVVSRSNREFCTRDGHLFHTVNLITYAPGVENYGVIPEGTEGISEGAFRLIPSPFERLYIPGSLSEIQPQRIRGGWFYNAEVSEDNIVLKSVDGSIYSIDGKVLVRAKISEDGFVVPEGTETICKGALFDVRGDVTIPASVTIIGEVHGFGPNVKKMITPKGSYAEWHVMHYKYMFNIEIVYDGEVEPWEPDMAKEEEKRPLPDFFNGLPF